MERRSYSNLHFINVIKGNLVSKLCNVNSHGKPALMFKKLKDTYEVKNSFLRSDSQFSSDRVMIESRCLPLADRTLREINPTRNEAVCTGSDSDDMTLKKLKQKCKIKKRIRSSSVGLDPQRGHVKLELEDDDTDLRVPLSSWKLKVPKAKKKCTRSSESPKLAVSIKSEQGHDPESPVQFHGDLRLPIRVKTEVPGPELTGCQSSTSSIDDTFNVDPTYESSVAQVIPDGNTGRVECQFLEPNIDEEEYQNCALNQVSYDHLEYVEPHSVLLPSFEEHMDVSNQEEKCQQFLDLPISDIRSREQIEQPLEKTLPSKDQSSDTNGTSRSCHLHELSVQSSNNPVAGVPDMVVDDSISRKEPDCTGDSCLFQGTINRKLSTNQQIATLGSSLETSSSSWSPCPCSGTEEELLPSQDDETEEKEPLSSWKLKVPKAKKKCTRSSESPKLAVSIKSEQGHDPESPVQFHGDLRLPIRVKTEVPGPELTGCQSSTSSIDDTFNVDPTYESSVAQVIPDGNTGRVECQFLEPNIDEEEYQNCALNQVSYDHLEYVEPHSVLLPSFEEHMDVSNQEERCQQFLDLPISDIRSREQIEQPLEKTLPSKHQSSDTNGTSRSCHLHELSVQSSNNPVAGVPDMVVDVSISRKEPDCAGDSCLFQGTINRKLSTNQQIATLGSSLETSSSSWSPCPCSGTEEELLPSQDDETEEKEPLKGNKVDSVSNHLNVRNHVDLLEIELSSEEEKKPPISPKIQAQRDSPSWNQTCAFDEPPSLTVPLQTLGRLLSTRKVISPTSEERFCLAMNSTESIYGIDSQDCKENLCNGKETGTRSSCEGSDKHGNASQITKGPVATGRAKFILNPSQIQRKPKHERTSPPKGNFEGPHLSRSLPGVTTGCTSVKGCSESAIAFSRRQMHDIESLAMKLMSELKSMKDIVEEKLLFEAYRNVSLKDDADEVKNAITNATKAEESARKWLSMMGRDCNRFCKIMSLTQKGTTPTASTSTVQKDRKKITFADEAGGMLCHVKFFENGMASLETNNVTQEDRTT